MLSFEIENTESRKAIMNRMKYKYIYKNDKLEACCWFKVVPDLSVGYICCNLNFVEDICIHNRDTYTSHAI